MNEFSDPRRSQSEEPQLLPHRGAEKPLVSIVMPCFNNEAYVAEAIDSALGQTYDNIEVIVIDDGSTDASLDIIRSYGDRITWRTGPNEGACAARNKGLALARGEFIKFLDADDILLPECIAAQVEQSAGIPRSVIVFGRVIRVSHDKKQEPNQPTRLHEDGDFATLAWLFERGAQTSQPLYRHELLAEVGGFRVGVKRGQEHDLNLRLSLAGAQFLYRHNLCVLYRQHSSPYRIKNQRPYQWCNNRFDSTEPIVELLGEARKVVSASDYNQLLKAVARHGWKSGRDSVRRGDTAAALQMFELARSIAGWECCIGNRTYRHLCRLVGPVFAERLGLARARIVSALKS